MISEGKKRKVRSDKKRDVKPTVPLLLKENINRLAYITNTPVKDVSETICVAGLSSQKVIEYLSNHFRREFISGNILYRGDLTISSLQKEKIDGLKERITIKFKESTFERIRALAYALDVTPTKATALLLEASVKNTDYIQKFVENHLEKELEPGKIKELKEVLKFINKNNPYEEEITIQILMSHLMDELKTGAITFSAALSNWLRKVK